MPADGTACNPPRAAGRVQYCRRARARPAACLPLSHDWNGGRARSPQGCRNHAGRVLARPTGMAIGAHLPLAADARPRAQAAAADGLERGLAVRSRPVVARPSRRPNAAAVGGGQGFRASFATGWRSLPEPGEPQAVLFWASTALICAGRTGFIRMVRATPRTIGRVLTRA